MPSLDFQRLPLLMTSELEQLPSDAGATLLRAPGVRGHEAELQETSEEFRGIVLL